MAPAGSFMSSHRNGGRSTTETMSPATSFPAKLTLSTKNLRSTSSLSHYGDSSAGAGSPMDLSPGTASTSHRTRAKPSTKRDTSHSSSPLSSGSKISLSSAGNHAKLHKRGTSSSNSLLGPPSLFQNGSHSHFTTPFATYEESSFPDVTSPSTSSLGSSGAKIKPYLRKMSSAKEDQGMIDLSKSTKENDRLAGLGIQDFGAKTVADVTFAHSRRGQYHGRTTSVGSQVSTGSGGLRPTQPFVHPMAKTPRPYTPPGGPSYAGSVNDEEANESDDIVEDSAGFKRRSISLSSTPYSNPTPLSQSHTASDLGLVPKLTSQSNLSLDTSYTDRSSYQKSRPRRGTDLSQEYVPSPSSRTSMDKAFSLVGRRSDTTETRTRDEQILEARRKFEEKEAHKDRKRSQSDAKKQERQRKKSDAGLPLKSALKGGSKDNLLEKKRRKSSVAKAGAEDEKHASKFRAVSYEAHRPTHAASLPVYGTAPGGSEKDHKSLFVAEPIKDEPKDGQWGRFSSWLQTRMLSCGGSRS